MSDHGSKDIKMRLDSKRIEVVDEKVAEILRTKTPSQRLKIAFDLWEMASRIITSHLKSGHPDWDQEKLAKEVARRLSHGAL